MTVETLEQKLKKLSEENLEANNLIMHYTAEIDDLEFELGQSNRVIKEQQAEIEQLRFDAMLLYASGLACEQVKAENDELKKQVDGQQAEIKQLTEENKKLVEEIDLEVDLQTKRKRQIITESQELIDELVNKNAELQKQIDELKFEDGASHSDGELRKVAKWISASTKPGVHAGMKCSSCGARIKYSEFYNGNHNFCHKCGAKMEVSNK